jgi:hypothetical protein
VCCCVVYTADSLYAIEGEMVEPRRFTIVVNIRFLILMVLIDFAASA